MRWVKTPQAAMYLFPRRIWKIKTKLSNLYLTFDDGPHPDITDYVLETLSKYEAKASFFCVGDNVRKFPEVVDRIKEQGHQVCNHGYHHLNGPKTHTANYIADVKKAQELIDSGYFRPPYGRISQQQASKLSQHFKLVMWTVLSYDFDQKVSPEQSSDWVCRHIAPGYIYVFHDSEKAFPRLRVALPELLKKASERAYRFSSLP